MKRRPTESHRSAALVSVASRVLPLYRRSHPWPRAAEIRCSMRASGVLSTPSCRVRELYMDQLWRRVVLQVRLAAHCSRLQY